MPCILIFQINYQKAHVSTLHTTTALLSPEIKSGTLSELLTRSLIGLSCCPEEKCLWHSTTKSWIVISVCWKVVKISTSLFRCFVNWHASCWGSEGKQMKGSFSSGMLAQQTAWHGEPPWAVMLPSTSVCLRNRIPPWPIPFCVQRRPHSTATALAQVAFKVFQLFPRPIRQNKSQLSAFPQDLKINGPASTGKCLKQLKNSTRV